MANPFAKYVEPQGQEEVNPFAKYTEPKQEEANPFAKYTQQKQQGEQDEFISAQQQAAKKPQTPEEKGFISSNIDYAKDALKSGWDSLISSGYGMQMSEAGEFIARLEEKYGKGAENAPPEKKKEYLEAVDLYKKANAGREQLSEERQQRYEKNPQRPATQEFKAAMSGFEKDELSFLDSAAKAGSAFLSNPVGVVADIGLESTPASLAALASALLVRLGFGSGIAVAGAGGSASAITEFGNEYAERRAKGMDHDKAWADAAVKSGVIGTIDAVSMNSAGSAAGKVMEALTGTKRISTAAKEVAKETGKQAAFGAAGEAGGSLAIGEIPNPAAVMAEAIGETFGAPLEAVSTYRSTGVAPRAAPPEAPPEAPPVAPPEETKQKAAPKETTQPTTFSEDNLIAMGIGKTNKKLREALIGKDLSNPDERAEVQSTLQEYLDKPKLSKGIRTKVDAFLSSPVMTSDISAVTPEAIDQTLAAPKVEAVQVPSLEGDPSEVEMDVGKAYASGKGVPVASPLGQLSVVALEDPNDNGELFIHDDMGEVVGSVFFTKDEAPDGTRFEPVFTIDNSYRDRDFDAAIYDLMHSLGAVTPKQEEVITAEPAKAEDLVPEFKKWVFDFAQEVHDRGEPLAQGAFFNILENWLSDNPEIAQAQSRGEGRNEVIDKAAEVFNNRLKELQEQTEPPVPLGMTRLYHGSATPDRTEGPAWFSTNREYAKNYRDGAQLQYVDYPTEKINAELDPDNIGQTVEAGFTFNKELDSSETGPRQILETPSKPAKKSAKAAKSLPQNIFIPPVPDNQRDGQEATAALEPEELAAPRQADRLPSLKRQIEQINRAFQEGRITAEEHAEQIRDTLNLHNLRLARRPIQPRSRGADFIRQKLLEAKRRGEISERAADLAEWFILQNPELVSGLGISIRQSRRGEEYTSGTYSRFERIMTLIKNTGADTTTVHEIFHHLERMMPREVQEAIRTAWRNNFTRARRQAERGDYDSLSSTLGKNLQTFFDLLNDYHFGTGKADTWTQAMQMLTNGSIPIEFYQYVDPSEFWAVNSTNIMQNRYDFSNSVMDRLRNWMREFKETVKSIFGIPSKAPLIRAIDSLLRGDSRFQSARMLSEGDMFNAGQYASINQPQRTPTPQAQAAIDELNKHGLGVKPDPVGFTEKMSAVLKDAKNNPASTLKSAKETGIRFSDWLGTKVFSADRALNNNMRRAVVEAGLGQEEILGYLLNMSLSQTNHSDAVAVNHLMYGDTKWDEDILKWRAEEDDGAKLSTLAKLTEDMAKAHGLSYEVAENAAHRAFESRRIQGLQKLNEKIREEMRDNYANGNIKEANRLRRKLKYIHLEQDQIDAASDLFNQFPELKEIDKVWNKMRDNTAKVLVDTGLWTEEEAKELLSYTDYVPFYREKDEETENNPKGMLRALQVQAKEKRLKGSDLDVVNVYDNMAQWAQFAINRAVRNRSNIALIDGLTEFAMAEKVSGPDKAKNVVKVWRDGKLEYYGVSDPLFLPAFQGMESIVIPILKQAATVSGLLRDAVVLNPLFTLAQVPADSYTAMFTSGLKPQYALRIPFIALKEFVTTIAGKSESHERLKKFAAVGVKDFMGSSALRDAQIEAGIMKNVGISRKILDYAKSGLKTFAMAGDNSVRQATYIAAKQAGLSEAEAIEKAFNLINFRNKGSSRTLRIMGQTVPFFNAYLAAMDVSIKTVTGIGTSPQDRMEGLKTLVYTSTAVSIMSLLYAMANADDEDYLKKPTQVRDRLLMIPGTGGLSIPLRKDMFLFPKIIAEHTYLLLTKKGFEDPKKFRDSMWTWLTSSIFSPNLTPQYIKPAVEVAFNRDFFMDRDLVPYYQQKMETSRKFNDATSELGKLIGKTGIVSPIGFDHLFKGYFGSVGGLFLNVTSRVLHNDPEVSRPELSFREMLNTVPGSSGFLSKPSENSLKTDFYELQAECNKAALTIKDIETRNPKEIKEALKDKVLIKRAMMAPEINKIGKELGEIRKQITYISNSPDKRFSPEVKSEKIEKLRKLEWNALKKMDVMRLRAMANL